MSQLQEKIEDILLTYKYQNMPLEQAVRSILSLYNLPHISLVKVRYESVLLDLAKIFVDYKFNKTFSRRWEVGQEIDKYIEYNKHYLLGQQDYEFDETLDLFRS